MERERHFSICDSVAGFSAAGFYDHAIRFHTLAADGQRNDKALTTTFYHSLSDEIKDRLATVYLPLSFQALVELSIKIGLGLG